MATKPKTKPAPAKTEAKGKNKAKPAKAQAAKASEESAAPKAPKEIYEEGTFVKFLGYKSNMDADEVVFSEGDILYITEVENDEATGILYNAIIASDLTEYEENGDEGCTGGQVSPAEVTALKGAALEKARDQYSPIAIVGKLAELLNENDNVIEVAIGLNQEIQETYFYLGGALAKILQTGVYLKENGGDYEGEDAFNDFCQAEFSFKASKGRQLARVYQTFSALPDFDPSKLDAVGWSKAAIAERFVTAENVDEVLDIAETTGQRELAFTLKEKYVTAEGTTASGKAASRGPQIVRKTLTFKLDEDSAETVQLVIQQAQKQYGIENEALALERIAVEWANDHVEADAAKKRISGKANKAAKARAATAAPKEDAKPAAAKKPVGKKK